MSKNSTAQSNHDCLLRHVDLEIKISSQKSGKTVSLYITKWDQKAHPNGLIRGAKVVFRQIRKMMSKKSNSYLVTTLFSTFQIIDVDPFLDQNPQNCFVQPIQFLYNMPENSSESYYCNLIVDKIIKMSITATCEACGKALKNGLCSFVGCHVGSGVRAKYVIKASFKVYDVSETVQLFCDNAKSLQRIMRWSDGDWLKLKNSALQNGELLFLISNNHNLEDRRNWFLEQCLTKPENIVLQFKCICRQFRKQQADVLFKSLYCVDVCEDKSSNFK